MRSNRIWVLLIAVTGLVFAGFNEIIHIRAWEISPITGSNNGNNTGLETVFSSEALSFETSQLVQTLARPLFATNRRPFAKKAIKIVSLPVPKPAVLKPKSIKKVQKITKPMPDKFPEFQLAGILMEGDSNKAYLKGDSLGIGRWVSDGEIIDEWQVFIIDKNSVKLNKQELSLKLKLYVDNGDN